MNTHSHYVLFMTVYLLEGSTHCKQAFVDDRVQSTDERANLRTCKVPLRKFASYKIYKNRDYSGYRNYRNNINYRDYRNYKNYYKLKQKYYLFNTLTASATSLSSGSTETG